MSYTLRGSDGYPDTEVVNSQLLTVLGEYAQNKVRVHIRYRFLDSAFTHDRIDTLIGHIVYFGTTDEILSVSSVDSNGKPSTLLWLSEGHDSQIARG